MTDHLTRKIVSAIEECDRYINKESARADDLRPPDTQRLLGWYIEHRARLVKKLAMAEKYNATSATLD